ncbi:MAG: hypothetical protein KGL39_32410 [Patescibacteria group bacterium]|nr:hypothetical protein [Patescibacteria group bacterium]
MIMATPKKRASRFLPSPSDIAAACARMRQDRGDEDRYYHTDESDYRSWRRAESRLASMAESERQSQEEKDIEAGKAILSEGKPQRRADIIRDMAGGTPQRAADANDGTEAKPGKSRSHYKSWQCRAECKRLLAAGESIPAIMEHFGISQGEKRVAAWLQGVKSDMEQRMKTLVAKVTKMTGAKAYRVTDQHGGLIKLTDGSGRPIDKGGYKTPAQAQEHVDAINASIRAKSKRKQTRKQRRAGKSAEIAAKRATRGGAVHVK